MANIEQFGSRTPEAESVKCIFPSTVFFYLTKTENRTKNSLAQHSQCCFE